MRALVSTRLSRALTAVAVALLTAIAALALPAAGPASAEVPSELDFSRYQPVNPDKFRSLGYNDNGRHFLRAGYWSCQLGPQPGSVACQGRPATAPPRTTGVAIVSAQSGPWWVPPNTTYRWGSRTGFRAPTLKVGQRVTVRDVVCARPSAGVMACASPNRAFIVSRNWHKFYYPAGSKNHDNNPPARYLPKRLR